MPKFLPVALAVLAAGAATAPAHAADPVYDVTLSGTIHHEVEGAFRDGDRSVTHRFEADTGINGEIGQISLRRGGATVESISADAARATYGSWEAHETWSGPQPRPQPRDFRCELETEPFPAGLKIAEDPLATLDGSVPLFVRVTDRLMYAPDLGSGTCPDGSTEAPLPIHLPTAELGEDLLDVAFKLPAETVGRGKTIQLFEGPMGDRAGRCPGSDGRGVTTCVFSFTGEVTLSKVDDSLLADLTTPQPPAPPTDPIDEDWLAPLVTAERATASRDGRTVRFTVTCPAGCTGTATVRARGAHAAGRRSARLALKLRPSAKPQAVRVTVPGHLRRAVRRGRASVLVALRPAVGGRTVTRVVRVRAVPRRA